MSVLGWFLILLCSASAATSNLLLRICIDQVGGFKFNIDYFIRLAVKPLFLTGVIFYGITTITWFRVIASEPMNLAYPIMISASFFWVTIGAAVLFHESLTLNNFIGLGLIVAGIYFVGK